MEIFIGINYLAHVSYSFSETKKRTSVRKRVLALQLDSDSVAKKIIEVYQKILKNK